MKSQVVNSFYDARAFVRKTFNLENDQRCSRCNYNNALGKKKSENKCLNCGYTWR